MKKRSWIMAGAWACMVALLVGCNNDDDSSGGLPSDIGDNNPDMVVALGDSITVAGYPAAVAGITGKTVINQGRGGERSAGGASRVSGVLSKYKPAYLLILYGANDAIHGADAAAVKGNLRAIIGAAQANKTVPIIANLTPMYDGHSSFQGTATSYNPEIKSLASEMGARFVNLAGEFGSERSLIQADGLHPTGEGSQVIAFAFSDKI